MALTKLQFTPGINRETTSYSNEGGWFDGDKIRFRSGMPEKIGGWQKYTQNYYLGTCRSIKPWTALDGTQYLGIGTNSKFYINEGGAFSDITPIKGATASGAVTFSASSTTLSADLLIGETTVQVTSSSGFPNSGVIQINSETILYAGIVSNTLVDCTRGYAGTAEAGHSSTDAVNCATLIVSDTGHEATQGDFVTFSGAVTLGGAITADVLNQEYEIVNVPDSDTYYVEARSVSTIGSITVQGGLDPSYVFGTSSDSGNGGGSVVGTYQINVGLNTTVVGAGWGSGTWGRGTWGSSASLTQGTGLRLWSQDNFGEDLLMCVRDGGIYYWDRSGGTVSRAVSLDSLPSADMTPTIAKQVLISDIDRHIIVLGCDSETNPGVQDPLLIRFSGQESLTEWATQITNTAGELRISSGSQIIVGVETRQQILVFTDTSLYAMQYLGPPFTFGINLISANLTIQSPNAVAKVDDALFWMGQREFYTFDGGVTRMPCSVLDYVFSDFNYFQSSKVTASANSAFSEVWWFYPSAGSNDNDRYVVYNYELGVWYYGTISRSCWIDRGVLRNPLAAGLDNSLYYQESGLDDGSTEPASAISSYIESSQMSIGDGNNYAFIWRMIPDITFRDSTSSTPTANFTVEARNFPGGPYLQSDTESVIKSASSPVEQFTNEIWLRIRGRSFAFKVDSSETGVAWRLGTPRADVRQDGRR